MYAQPRIVTPDPGSAETIRLVHANASNRADGAKNHYHFGRARQQNQPLREAKGQPISPSIPSAAAGAPPSSLIGQPAAFFGRAEQPLAVQAALPKAAGIHHKR